MTICDAADWHLEGWLSTLAWQTGTAGASYIMASQIQGLLILNNPSYVFQRWHGTLLIIAIASLATLCNTVFAKQLPRLEIVVLALYTAGFFGIIITLWMLAPKTSARTVFTEFQNNGGWPSQGLSVLIGLTGPSYTILGLDCGVHLGRPDAVPCFPTKRPTFLLIRLQAKKLGTLHEPCHSPFSGHSSLAPSPAIS